MGWLPRERKREPQQFFVRAMTFVNLAVVMLMLLGWATMPALFADPLYLVTGSAPSMHPSPFEYPAVLLWFIPLMAVVGTYQARYMYHTALARVMCSFPSMLAAACAGWIYYTGAIGTPNFGP